MTPNASVVAATDAPHNNKIYIPYIHNTKVYISF